MASELSEAVLSASGASALIQKQIDPVVHEMQRRYAPLVRVLPTIRWGSTVYNFNQRTQVAAGGFVTDGGARPISTSTYVQNAFTIKNLQAVGGVTGYAEAVTADLIGSLRAREIQGTARGLEWDIETGLLWGNAGSTLNGPYPQFDGLDSLINLTTGTAPNTLNWANGAFDLGLFDQLIEIVEENAAEYPGSGTEYAFVVSSTVESRIAQLLTNQQRFIAADHGALTNVEVAPGLIVASYRNIPIMKTSFLNPRGNQMGTVTATTATSGGSLPATTNYKYMVSAVIARFGEILASAEVSETTGSGSTNIITLAFTPPSVTQLGQTLSPTHYKVWRTAGGGGTGTETLLGFVDANVGLNTDGVTPIPTTSIVDTGVTLVPQNGSTVPATYPAAYVGTNAGFTPPATNQQNVYLLPRDPDLLIRPYVREMQTVNVYPTTSSPDSLPFAFVADTCLAVRDQYFMARATNVLVALAS